MHTFWKMKRKKNKLSSLPLSMEGQTHLTLGRKEEIKKRAYIHEKLDKPNSGKSLAASFHGRSVTPTGKKKE